MSPKKRASETQINGDHYKSMPIQPSEFIYKNALPWLEGNAIKYICRHSRKHGADDIHKAIHYLELLLEWEYSSELDDLEQQTQDQQAVSEDVNGNR